MFLNSSTEFAKNYEYIRILPVHVLKEDKLNALIDLLKSNKNTLSKAATELEWHCLYELYNYRELGFSCEGQCDCTCSTLPLPYLYT